MKTSQAVAGCCWWTVDASRQSFFWFKFCRLIEAIERAENIIFVLDHFTWTNHHPLTRNPWHTYTNIVSSVAEEFGQTI